MGNFPDGSSGTKPCRAALYANLTGSSENGEAIMTLGTILLIILILLLVGAIPSWPYSRGWGYGPSGILGVVLVVLLVLVLMGRL
jgi:uncharacterized protein DUF3309